MDIENLEEPDVTPLINVNLVILVMILAIASHAARLLPLEMPKAEQTEFLEMSDAVLLRVQTDKAYQLQGSPLTREALPGAIDALEADSVVLIAMDSKAPYDSLIWAVDSIMTRPDLQVAFGQPPPPAAATTATTAPAPPAPAGN